MMRRALQEVGGMKYGIKDVCNMWMHYLHIAGGMMIRSRETGKTGCAAE